MASLHKESATEESVPEEGHVQPAITSLMFALVCVIELLHISTLLSNPLQIASFLVLLASSMLFRMWTFTNPGHLKPRQWQPAQVFNIWFIVALLLHSSVHLLSGHVSMTMLFLVIAPALLAKVFPSITSSSRSLHRLLFAAGIAVHLYIIVFHVKPILEPKSENTNCRELVITAAPILLFILSYYCTCNHNNRGNEMQQENYRSLVENINELIVKIERKDFAIQFMNREFLDLTPDSCIGKTFSSTFFAHDTTLQQCVEQHLVNLFEKRENQLFEWSITRKQDEERGGNKELHFCTHISPIVKQDTVIAAISLTTDITDRRKASEASLIDEHAKIASKSKSEFIASMSHELRNPLHAILCTLQLLSSTENISQTQMNYIEDINENAKLLKSILSDVLDMSKIESGKIELIDCPESIVDIVETSVDIFSSQAAAKGLEIFSYVDSQIQAELLMDKTRLQQILTNFISNAIKFTKKGHVFLRAVLMAQNNNEQTIQFSCTDTGIGINVQDISKLFKPWIQVSTSENNELNVHGYGLGLTICEKLVTLMNGKIFVNTMTGIGSTFGFEVSLKKGQPEHQGNIGDRLSHSLYRVAIVMHQIAQFNEVLDRYLKVLGVETIHYSTDTKQVGQIVKYYKELNVPLLVIMDELFSQKVNPDKWVEDECKVINLVNKYTNAEENKVNNMNNQQPIVYLKKPLKLTRLMYALSGRRNSMTSSLLWDDNFTQRLQIGNISSSSIELLIVEDNPINQKVVMKLLNQLGFKSIDCASNGEEALEKIDSHLAPYSLVLMDLQMPKMDGLTCTRNIRSLQDVNKRSMPIVALTANAWQDSVNECISAGMNDVLTKPVTLESLMRKLQQHTSAPLSIERN